LKGDPSISAGQPRIFLNRERDFSNEDFKVVNISLGGTIGIILAKMSNFFVYLSHNLK
jgi:hypothetical protein